MAKFPSIPVTDNGYWCDARQCKTCTEWYDFCICNGDCATDSICEECNRCGESYCKYCTWIKKDEK